MISVKFDKEESYPVDTSLLKKRLREFFKERGIVSDSQVSVAIVGEEKMKTLAKEYLKEDPPSIHNVLSFPFVEGEGKFVYPPDDPVRLGEIILCFPKLKEEAEEEGATINEKASELVEHGAQHLLGIHHD